MNNIEAVANAINALNGFQCRGILSFGSYVENPDIDKDYEFGEDDYPTTDFLITHTRIKGIENPSYSHKTLLHTRHFSDIVEYIRVLSFVSKEYVGNACDFFDELHEKYPGDSGVPLSAFDDILKKGEDK